MLRICLFIIIFFVTINCVKPEICGPIEIRNSVNHFEKQFRNCSVVVSIQLLLLERTTEKDFKDLSFPNLREVLEFFVLYRVKGLTSIGKLFPNLSVIRGRKLYFDYSLIIFDLANLIEVSELFIVRKKTYL